MATIGMLALMFLGMTFINRVLEGQFIANADVAIMNQFLVFRPLSVWGWFSVPIPNLDYVIHGLPKLLTWDYSFFGGNAALIEYLLYSITAFIMFALFLAILGVVAGRIGRA